MWKISDDNIIAIFAAVFSGISIVVTVLSMIMEKSLIGSQNSVLIKMDVNGKCVLQQSKSKNVQNNCRRRVRKIRQAISGIIGFDYAMMEMSKPRQIPNGLQLEVYLYGTEVKQEYEDLLNKAQQNGSLAECISSAWSLKSIPNISNIVIEGIQTQQYIESGVEIVDTLAQIERAQLIKKDCKCHDGNDE